MPTNAIGVAVGQAVVNRNGGVAVEVANLGEALRRLAKYSGERLTSAFAAGVYLFACQVISRAARLAPVATGWLRSSFYVVKPRLGGEEFIVIGGFSATYSYVVETRDVPHRTGQAHFTATAIAENMPRASSLIIRTVRSLLKNDQSIESVSTTVPDHPFAGGGRLGHAAAERRASVRRARIYKRRAKQQRRRRSEGMHLRWE